ncbi:hypothetical protein DFJ43DRAFT_990693, partial [Lentinula guzmanii]
KLLVGEGRLWKLLVAHSVHLIWSLRCERVIRNESRAFSKNEIKNRWTKMMNSRLDLDRSMTHPRFEKKVLSKMLVLQMWKGVLLKEQNLPNDWADENVNGVLVGICNRRRCQF